MEINTKCNLFLKYLAASSFQFFFFSRIEIVIATDKICIILSFGGPDFQKVSAYEILVVTEVTLARTTGCACSESDCFNIYSRIFGPFQKIIRS
jgi:hypothetical protein